MAECGFSIPVIDVRAIPVISVRVNPVIDDRCVIFIPVIDGR